MDVTRLLEEMGEVPPADDAVIDAAMTLVLEAARGELVARSPGTPTSGGRRLGRPALLSGAALVTVAAVVAVVALLPGASRTPGPVTGTAPGPSAGVQGPTVLTAATVRLIASQSTAATANSGTAVEITTDTTGSSLSGQPATTDVTFSGPDVNFLIVGNANGAAGVQNRVVDGQLYLYIKGPDLQMHWYHDTAPDAAASLTFPDPRTLLQAVSPAAGLENLGPEPIGGTELTHLRARNPGPIGKLGIAGVGGTVTAFDVWVDRAHVVRQMSVVMSGGGPGYICSSRPAPNSSSAPLPTATIPPGHKLSVLPGGKVVPPGVSCLKLPASGLRSTLDVAFADLGQPETITAPSGAIDQEGLG